MENLQAQKGKLIWWELRNTDKLIPVSQFKTKAEELGFKMRMKKVTQKAIVTEVCRRLGLIKKVFEYAGEKYIGGFEDKDVNEESLFARAAILLKLRTGEIIAKTEEVAEELENVKGSITPYKIMQYVVAWITNPPTYGFNVRRNGALYFIPEENASIIAKIDTLLRDLDIGEIRVIDIEPTSKSLQSLILEFITEMTIKLNDIERISKRKKREDKAEGLLKKIKQIKDMVARYQEKFHINEEKLEELKHKINALERRFVKVIG